MSNWVPIACKISFILIFVLALRSMYMTRKLFRKLWIKNPLKATDLGIPPGTFIVSSVEVMKILKNNFEDLELEDLRKKASKAFRDLLLSFLFMFLLIIFLMISFVITAI